MTERGEKQRTSAWLVCGKDNAYFAALYNEMEAKEEWFSIAEAGRKALDTGFCTSDGRFCQMMDAKGNVLKGPVSIFTDILW